MLTTASSAGVTMSDIGKRIKCARCKRRWWPVGQDWGFQTCGVCRVPPIIPENPEPRPYRSVCHKIVQNAKQRAAK